MADDPKTKEDMVELLKRSVEEWNTWRKQCCDIFPDLSGVDLCEANLCDAELSGVDLHGARLMFANLLCAKLDGANLVEAKLLGANLRGAYVRWANLAGVDLRNADVVADLRERISAGLTSARRRYRAQISRMLTSPAAGSTGSRHGI